MPVTEQTPRTTATGNAVTTVFAYNFRIFADADLTIMVDGVLKTLTTDYTVSGAGDAGGGSVTFVTAPADGAAITIYRDLSYTRATDYQTNGDLPADTLDDDFDRAVMLVQQVNDQLTRVPQVGIEVTGFDASLPDPAANQIIGFNSDATGFTTFDPTDIATTIVGAGYNLDTFSGDGSTVAFALTTAPGNENNTQVFVGGVYQNKSTYSVSDVTLTFDSAPASGANNIEVTYATAQVTNITTIDADSVNTAAVQDSAVTYAKIQDISATQRVVGRNSAGAGVAQEVSLEQILGWLSGVTALTAPAVADSLPIYDASAAAGRLIALSDVMKVIDELTAETAPDVADELALYDASAGTADKITLANLLKVINGLTADATPDAAADYLLSYDASAGAAKKVLMNSLGYASTSHNHSGVYVAVDHGHGNVGSLLFGRTSSTVAAGGTVAGSNLVSAGIEDAGAVYNNATPLTGTWRCLGAVNGGGITTMSSLFQRIS